MLNVFYTDKAHAIHHPVIFIVLAVFFIFYGICVMALRSGSRFYVVWFGLAAWMLLLSAAFGSNRFPVMLRRAFLILLIIFLAFVAVTWGCMLRTFYSRGEKGVDEIVVLGAQVRTTGPSRVLRYRLDTAYQYLTDNPETQCIVSGGQGYNEPEAEASVMKKYLIEKGMEENRIAAETESENTHQNLVNSAKLIDRSDRVAIVTNNFHLFRAISIAKKCGYENVCGIAAPSDHFFLLNNMLRESFGIVKDFAAGNM